MQNEHETNISGFKVEFYTRLVEGGRIHGVLGS